MKSNITPHYFCYYYYNNCIFIFIWKYTEYYSTRNEDTEYCSTINILNSKTKIQLK